MKKAEIEIGGRYIAKVSGKETVVKIIGTSPYGGWVARNADTGREVRVRTAARLRRPASAAAATMPAASKAPAATAILPVPAAPVAVGAPVGVEGQ